MARKPAPSPKSGLSLTYELGDDDIAAFHDYHLWRHSRRAPVALGLIVVVGTIATLTTRFGDPFTNALLSGVLPLIAFIWTMFHSRRKMVRLARQMGIVGSQALEVSPRGFRQHRGDGVEIRRKWTDPLQIVEAPTHLFLYVNPTQAVIIPRAAFATAAEREEFLNRLREWSGSNS